MNTRQPRLVVNNRAPYQPSKKLPVPPAPLLTLERALADRISPLRLRQVAKHNLETASGKRAANVAGLPDRLRAQAAHLQMIASQLEQPRAMAA